MLRQIGIIGFVVCCMLGLAVGGVTATEMTADRSFADEADPGETVTVTTTIEFTEDTGVDYIENITPAFAELNIQSMTHNGDNFRPIFTDTDDGSVLIFTDERTAGTIEIIYEVQVPETANPGDQFEFDGEVSPGVNAEPTPVGGDTTLTVSGDADADGEDTQDDDDDREASTDDTVALSIVVPLVAFILVLGILFRRYQ